MIQTIAVYSFLTIIMMYLSYVGREKKLWKYMIYAMVAYSIIFGLRYGVGVDYFNYYNNYQSYITSDGKFGGIWDFEIGFLILTTLIASTGVHFSLYFAIIAFIQIFFTFLAFRKDYKIYPFLIFTFMVGCSWLTYSNGLRQILVVSLWIYSIKFIAEKKPIQYYAYIAIAITFHTSAALLLIMYPVLRFLKKYSLSVKLQLCLLIVSLIIMKISILQTLLSKLDTLMDVTGYGKYASQGTAVLVENETHIGLGFVIFLILVIIIIILSKKVKEWNTSTSYKIFYDLFIIGFALKYIFLNSLLFSRINYYFINVTFIVAGFTIRYAHSHNKKLYYALLGLYILTFVATISKASDNTALFIFCWQDDLYHLK